MSVTWSIEYDGVMKPVASWGPKGFQAVTRNLRNQVSDELTWVEPLQDSTIEDTIPDGALVKLYRDEVKVFQGIITEIAPQLSLNSESKQYTAMGGWYYLDNHVFKQTWKTYTGDPDNLGTVKSSHVFLAMANNLGTFTKQNSKEQIQEALDYAIASGAPIAYDLTDCPAVDFNIDEKRDITCGDAIRATLRWVPDAVVWWDYSTTLPTFKVARRTDLEDVTLDVSSGARIRQIQPIKKRFDLKRPAVVFRYEQQNAVNGFNWIQHVDDKYPLDATGDELKALVMTINLQGISATFSTALIESDLIEKNSIDWWKARVSWLNETTIASAVISNVTRTGDLNLPRELIGGTFPPWMEGQDKQTEDDTIEADILVIFPDGTKRTEHVSYSLTATDAVSGTYTNTVIDDAGEPIPVGLASVFYEALNRDEYEGTIELIEQDCVGDVSVGKRLNLSNGKAAWATMGEIIWGITEDIDSGTTTVSFGPAPYLSANDMIELLKANRNRLVYTSLQQRIGATNGQDRKVELPKRSVVKNTSSSVKQHNRLQVQESVSGSLGLVDIDATQAFDSSNNPRPLKIREVIVCVDGVNRKMLALCSENYD